MRTVFIIFFVFISVLFTSVNIIKGIRGEAMPFGNFLYMSIGFTGVITYFLNIW